MARKYSRGGGGAGGPGLILIVALLAVAILLLTPARNNEGEGAGLFGSRDPDAVVLTDMEITGEEDAPDLTEKTIVEDDAPGSGSPSLGVLVMDLLGLAAVGGVLLYMQFYKKRRREYGGKAKASILRIPKAIRIKRSGRKAKKQDKA